MKVNFKKIAVSVKCW